LIRRRKIWIALVVCISTLIIAGCEGNSSEEEKIRDVEFTVVSSVDIPEQLVELIEQRQEEPFKITYSDKKNLYIVVGYGAQPTSGYSIAVKEFYEGANSMHLQTLLKGPSKTETITEIITFPYIVLMIEDTDKPVQFK